MSGDVFYKRLRVGKRMVDMAVCKTCCGLRKMSIRILICSSPGTGYNMTVYLICLLIGRSVQLHILFYGRFLGRHNCHYVHASPVCGLGIHTDVYLFG